MSSSSSSSQDVQPKRERRQALDYEAVGKLMAGAQSKTLSKNSQTAIRCWRCGQEKHGGACKPQDYINYEKQLIAIDQAFQRVCPPEGWNSTYEAEIEEESRTGDFTLKRLGNRKNCLRVELRTKVGEFHKHGAPSFARRWWTLRTTLREMHTYLELETRRFTYKLTDKRHNPTFHRLEARAKDFGLLAVAKWMLEAGELCLPVADAVDIYQTEFCVKAKELLIKIPQEGYECRRLESDYEVDVSNDMEMIFGHLPLVMFRPYIAPNTPSLNDTPGYFAKYKPGYISQYFMPLRSFHSKTDLVRDVRYAVDMLSKTRSGDMTMEEYENLKMLTRNEMLPASATNRYILMRCAPTHILVDLKSTNRDPGALMNMRNVCEKLSIMQEVSNSQDTLVAMGGLGNATNTGDGHKSARKLNRKKNRYIRGLQKQGQLFPTAHDGTTINRTFSKEKSGTVGKQWFTIQKSAIKVKNEQRAKYAAAAAIKVETSSSSSSKSDSKKRNAATSGQSSNKKQRGSKKMV